MLVLCDVMVLYFRTYPRFALLDNLIEVLKNISVIGFSSGRASRKDTHKPLEYQVLFVVLSRPTRARELKPIAHIQAKKNHVAPHAGA